MVLARARAGELPAVAMCISTTYGPGDWAPTPHGSMLALVAAGRFPFYFDWSAEVVGIEDAARAMILAAQCGRVGERYIVSDRYLSTREGFAIAARAAGAEVLGVSLVTNLAAGMTADPVNHEEVLAAGRESAGRLGSLLRAVLQRL